MNIFKKTLAILLSLSLIFGVMPLNTYAAENNDVAVVAEMGTKPADGTTTKEPFPQGTGGSNSFRIPSLVTLSDGTLVAAADARWNTTYDGGGLDTIVSRSSDGGANWNYTFANYLGDNGNKYNGSSSTCFIDPAMAVTSDNTIYMLVDLYPYGIALNGSGNTAPSTEKGFDDNGRLLLSGNNNSSYGYYLENGNIYKSNGTLQSGYTVDEHFNITGADGIDSNLFFSDSPYKVVRTGFLYLTKSTDKGKTWSAPTLLNLKTTSEQVCLVGPGRGLVTSSGMIVFPVYSYNGSQDSQKMSFIYSTDKGATWTRSTSFSGASWSSESAVVELKDGTLRFFYRNGTTNLCYVDYANGSWGSVVNTGLDTNSNCQISAITYSKTTDGKQVILVSCPTGPNEAGSDQSGASYRQNGKIFIGLVNEDKTINWQTDETISVESVHSTNSFMYSCLTELENGDIAILYEDNESNWGTGNNSYYQMSYATYDYPLTADAGNTGDSGDSGDSSGGEVEGDNDVAPINTVNVELSVGEVKEYTEGSGNYSNATVNPDTLIATIGLEGNTVAGGTTAGDAVASLVNGTAYYIKSGDNYLTSSATWTDEISEAATWTWDNNRRLSNDGNYLRYNSGTLSTTTYTSRGNRWTNSNGSLTYNSYTLGTAHSVVNTEPKNSTTVTITGVKPGTTTAVVGSTQYNITVNKAAESASVAVGSATTFTAAGTKIESNANDKVATATISDGVLTVNAIAVGTTTITTDYGVYTITVSDGIAVSIKENEDEELSVDLENGQYVEWSTADSSYVGVAGKYDSEADAYTDSAVIIGHNITESPVVVTGIVYNADGTKAGEHKWLVTVTEGDADTNTYEKHVYVNVKALENCTVYYAVNGGELIKVNGTGVLINKDVVGKYNIMFFAKPNEGYALTYMGVSGSDDQYYTLSNGNPDGTGSDAWPFVAEDQTTIPSSANDSAWATIDESKHGFRWALLEGNMSIEQMKIMFSNAIALGCDGATTMTRNAEADLSTEITFVARKLPEMEKHITSVTSANGTVTKYVEGMEIGLGDTINYTITVYEPYYNDSYGEVSYTAIDLRDPLTGDTWNSKSNTSERVDHTFIDSATNEKITLPVTAYHYNTELTLTAGNFLSLVQDGKIINTATLNYDYSSKYTTGHLSTKSEAVAEIMVDVPEYVIDFGLPVEIDLTNDPLVEDDEIIAAAAQYGSVEITDKRKVIYTPNEVLQGTDFIKLTFADGGNESAIVGYGVRIYPATTIYYEESFLGAGWTQVGTPESDQQAAERINEENSDGDVVSKKVNNYGFDPAYNATTDSDSYITANSIGTTSNMTFTGTGIDIYANCLENTGYVSVRIKDATSGKTYMVNTVAINGDSDATKGQTTIKNAPIVSVRDLEHGTYNVSVTKVMDTKAVQIDGFRVYNTVADSTVFSEDLEDNPDFYELRDEVLSAVPIGDNTSEKYGTIAEMSEQVYKELTDEDAAVIVGPEYSDAYTSQDLLDNGPKNELLLHKDATLIFSVETNRDIQVGLKAPNGATSYKITGATAVNGNINSTVEQFYDMGVTPGTKKEYTFTIQNTGSNILSVTLLKICDDPNAKFVTLTEQDIADALKASGYGSEAPGTPDTPTIPEDPETPDTPDTPTVPEDPENPDTPDTPVVPGEPSEPEHECTMEEVIKPATVNKAGKIEVKCTECGEVESTKVIYKASNVKLGLNQFVYNGKVKNPKVIVKDSKGNIIAKKYYSVTKPVGRKNVGKYTYTIKFKGNYEGTKKLTLTVKPKATAVKKVTAAKKAFTVKWSKVSKQATGYEIMYATNSKFTKGKKTVTVKNYKVTSKKIAKLKAKQKYYVKVRTYKTVKVNGKNVKIYSDWSKYRTVTTKR